MASLVNGPPLMLTVSPPAVVPYSGLELVISPAKNGSVFVSLSLVSLVSTVGIVGIRDIRIGIGITGFRRRF